MVGEDEVLTSIATGTVASARTATSVTLSTTDLAMVWTVLALAGTFDLVHGRDGAPSIRKAGQPPYLTFDENNQMHVFFE